MRKRKVVLVLLALFGVYVFAAGGLTPLVRTQESALAALFEPFRLINPFDSGVLMMSVVLLTWAYLLERPGSVVVKRVILEAAGYGSVLLATVFIIVLLAQMPSNRSDELTGLLALMAFLQCFVGLAAGFLLVCHAECRRLARLPLILNGSLTAILASLVCLPMIV